MKEFGSDFHRCDNDFRGESNWLLTLGSVRTYACGRHAIDAIVTQEGWKKIWIPAYFCYEVIGHIASTGIEVKLYDDNPLREDDEELVRALSYEEGDVLLRMNYFGLRGKRTNKGIPVPVIEDHTHDLISEWTSKSNADWCIASIRKSLPVAAGGILWSPIGFELPDKISSTDACEQMAELRYEGMQIKKNYLKGEVLAYESEQEYKDAFREKYLQSEEMIEVLGFSGMDRESKEIIQTMNLKLWTDLRYNNWRIAYELLKDRFTILKSSEDRSWQPFSLIILCDNAEERTALRLHLLENKIYPAILWMVPENVEFYDVIDFSERMLSVHCDIRYSRKNIEKMCDIINKFKR